MESSGKKKPRPRRSFTAEFKAEIVELCQRDDRSVGQIAKDIGSAIFDYIQGCYNTRRRHSTVGYLSPATLESTHEQVASTDLTPNLSTKTGSTPKSESGGHGTGRPCRDRPPTILTTSGGHPAGYWPRIFWTAAVVIG